jgi:hypothetical protein
MDCTGVEFKANIADDERAVDISYARNYLSPYQKQVE